MKFLLNLVKKILMSILPKEPEFFELYQKMLKTIGDAIVEMKGVTAENVYVVKKLIIEYENKCDSYQREIRQRLSQSITSPPQLSRDKVIYLGSVIDDIMDNFKSIARLLEAGNGEVITLLHEYFPVYWKILEKLEEANNLLVEVLDDFSKGKLADNDPRLEDMHDIENAIDDLHTGFINENLWNSKLPGKNLVVVKIIDPLEDCGDKYQSVVNIIQEVLANG